VIRPSYLHAWSHPWASWCKRCRRETTDLGTCKDCGASLEGAMVRGPFDPELTPSLVKVLLERAKEAA
jgi:hypothetical protein